MARCGVFLTTKPSFSLRRTAKRASVFLVLALVVVGALLGNKLAQAATTYQIADVGEITKFEMSNPSGVLGPSNGVIFDGLITLSSVEISGVIHGTENLAAGDKISLTIAAASSSTYYLHTILALDSALKDATGVTQFDISASYGNPNSTLALTKTNASLSGDFSFNIQGKQPQLGVILTNYPSGSTTFTLAGKTIAFPNSAKTETTTNSLAQAIASNRSANSAVIAPGLITTKIYNYLLKNPSATAQDLENEFGASVLNTNLIQVATITAATGSNIINITGSSSATPSHTTYILDILDDQSGLNYGFIVGVNSYVNSYTDHMVTLTPNSTFDQLQTQVPNPYDFGVTKNSDGTWTLAINQGPILGGLNYYAAWANANNMPNTVANNAVNSDLIARARALQLMPERFWRDMRVTFSDPTLQETANYVVQSNLFPNYVGAIGDTPVSNSAAGQTAVKVYYVDMQNNPVEAANVSYGWPADNTVGETPTAPISVSPHDLTSATPQKYALVTDDNLLTDFAANEGLDRAQIFTAAANVSFPDTDDQQIDIYYVYAPIYDVNFDTNGAGDTVSTQNVVQNDGSQAATEPTAPTRNGYKFGGWFIDAGFTTEYDFAVPVNQDITLHAKWLKLCQWDPSLLDDDQSCVAPTVPKPIAPIVPGAPNTGVHGNVLIILETW
jgi:uncharacterized repeat protein (TIGR02543 family)